MTASLKQFAGEMKSEADQHKRPKYPSGWDPSVVSAGDTATAVSEAFTEPDPSEAKLVTGWGMDPAEWQIVGKVNCRKWMSFDGQWLYYYKADLQRIDKAVHQDVQALYKRIQGRKNRAYVGTGGELTFLALIGDTQIGKGDGDGSVGTIDRWQNSLDATIQRIRSLRKVGYDIGAIALAFMGDLGESCSGNYPAQAFTTDLTMREQDGVLQELAFDTFDRFAPLASYMDVLVVPGNHGEQRNASGKAFTLPSDNRDIAVIETVHRGIRRNTNAAFDHLNFVYPSGQELTVARDLSGVPVAFAHGHQFGNGGTPAKKAENWWKDQAHGKTINGDCDILFSAHYHHLLTSMSGRKTHIQIPSLDGGSQWWENMKAQVSAPGMVSCLIGEGIGPAGCGWDELRVC